MSSFSGHVELPSTKDLLSDTQISYLKVATAPADPEVDIVAVHGLNIPINFRPWKDPQSFGIKTWIAGDVGGEKLWPKDFLPQDIDSARVLLFGYNSHVGWDTSIGGVSGAADDLLAKLRTKRQSEPSRPIVFICHSLGGIVVKHAISKARSNPRYQELYESVKAIAFFASPHRRGHGATKGAVAAGAIRRVTGSARTSIMEALRPDSLISSDIHEYFLQSLHHNDMRVCTFYELKPVAGLRDLVVDRNSAILGLGYPLEDTVPVPESDHRSICKFASRTFNYELVIERIRDLVEWATKSMVPVELDRLPSPMPSIVSLDDDKDSSSSWSNPYTSMPLSYSYLPDYDAVSQTRSEKEELAPKSMHVLYYLQPNITNSQFVGRKAILDRLEQILAPGQNTIRAALHGLGGTGKTSIAFQALRQYESVYPHHLAFWMNAGTVDKLRQCLMAAAVQCGITNSNLDEAQAFNRLREFLSDERNGNWIAVVDEVGSPNTFANPSMSKVHPHDGTIDWPQIGLMSYLPKCAHGRVLLTTNNKAVAEQLSTRGYVVEVRPFESFESFELLVKELSNEGTQTDDPPSYQRNLPTDEDIKKLCEYLNHLPLAISQAAAFMRQQNLTVSEYIQLLDVNELGLLNLLDHDFKAFENESGVSRAVGAAWNITFSHIRATWPKANDTLSFISFLDPQVIPKSLLQSFEPNEWDLTVTVLGTLQNYALLSPGVESGTFNTHRLVQLAIRKYLRSLGIEAQWASNVLSVLASSFPDGSTASWDTCASLLPHAIQVLKNDFSKSPNDCHLAGQLELKISRYYSNAGFLIQAERLSHDAVRDLESTPSASKELILAAKAIRVITLKNTSHLDEAESLAKEVWYGRQGELGAKHVDTMESYNTLALIYQEQGQFRKAVDIARKNLRRLQKTPGADPSLIQDSKRRIGTILHNLAEYAEAEKWVREALEERTKSHGAEDQTTMKFKWRLGWILHSQGKYEEAMQVQYEVWTDQKRVLGVNNVHTLITLNMLADNMQALSKFKEALEYKREVHEKAIGLVGPDHRYRMLAATSLASCLIAQSPIEWSPAHQEAEDLYKLALTGFTQKQGPDHPETISAKTNVATMLRLRGEFENAETMERETLKHAKTILHYEHPIVLASRENLARVLWQQRVMEAKRKEAVEQAKKVLKAKDKRLGWAHGETKEIAGLVVEMMADGREKERLRKRIAGE